MSKIKFESPEYLCISAFILFRKVKKTKSPCVGAAGNCTGPTWLVQPASSASEMLSNGAGSNAGGLKESNMVILSALTSDQKRKCNSLSSGSGRGEFNKKIVKWSKVDIVGMIIINYIRDIIINIRRKMMGKITESGFLCTFLDQFWCENSGNPGLFVRKDKEDKECWFSVATDEVTADVRAMTLARGFLWLCLCLH